MKDGMDDRNGDNIEPDAIFVKEIFVFLQIHIESNGVLIKI